MPVRWLILFLVGIPCAAFALDKQGSAHGGNAQAESHGFHLSGNVGLGVAPYNPSYAARPDNSGRVLLRYSGHLDLDLLGPALSIPLDLNFFTDRSRPGFWGKVSPSEFDVITGLTSTWRTGPGAIEMGARVEHDLPLDQGSFTQTYLDVRVRYLHSFGAQFPNLRSALGDGDISGWATLGWFAVNPTYAARPDNSGLALLRYALHLEVSGWAKRVGFAIDTTFFTDRKASALRPSELDLTLSVILRHAPWEFQLAFERDMPVDRGGFTQSFLYALIAFGFG